MCWFVSTLTLEHCCTTTLCVLETTPKHHFEKGGNWVVVGKDARSNIKCIQYSRTKKHLVGVPLMGVGRWHVHALSVRRSQKSEKVEKLYKYILRKHISFYASPRAYNMLSNLQSFGRTSLDFLFQLYGTNLKCYLINPSGMMGIFRGFSFRSTTKTDVPVPLYLYVCMLAFIDDEDDKRWQSLCVFNPDHLDSMSTCGTETKPKTTWL